MTRLKHLGGLLVTAVLLSTMSACNLNTSSENVMSNQKDSSAVPDEIKDSPLKISEVYGVDIVMLGTLEKFFVDIGDNLLGFFVV